MGTMPAVRRMTSAQPDRCSPRYSLVGVHDARDEQRGASQLEPAECLAHLARDCARHVVETGSRAVEAIDHPAPHALGEHRVDRHLGVNLGAHLAHDAERAVPADLLHGIMQHDHATGRQGLSRRVLVYRAHRQCGRKRRQTTRRGHLFEEDMRQVVGLSQGQQSPNKLLGHRVLIHD